MTGQIPTSGALAEASADSISDLFSRDPEGWTPTDEARAIEALRAQRAKWVAAEAAGAKPRQPKAPGFTPGSKVNAKAEDLGL